MKKFFLALITSAALMACNLPGASAQEYTIGNYDHLNILIVNHGDLSKDYVVSPDGTISFQLIGTVTAKDKTVEEFRQELVSRFSKYLVEPEIVINLGQLHTTRVYVMGEVHRQGSLELTKSHRVMDALGAAGGFTRDSAKSRIYLIRAKDMEALEQAKGDKKAQEEIAGRLERININAFLRRGDVSQNPMLNEGDTLYVVRNHRFDLLGLVKSVGRVGYFGKANW
ncbi:MAG: polysaccharide export protein [Bacteroidaceae bacterium]|nr:polysaccharide export protein [Bacteroidaceae bacterium]